MPGYRLTVDKSVFACYGKEDHPEGLARVIKIKPKPKGVKAKTIGDGLSGIMFGITVNECKDAMFGKHYQAVCTGSHYGIYPEAYSAVARQRVGCARVLLVCECW